MTTFGKTIAYCVLASTAVLAACSNNTVGMSTVTPLEERNAVAPLAVTKAATTTSALLVVTIPAKPAGRERPRYISPSTKSMAVDVKGETTQTFDLSSTSPGCASGSTGITCNENLSLQSGRRTLQVTLFSRLQGKGEALSTETVIAEIAANKVTTIPLVLGGVVAAVHIEVGGRSELSIANGTPASFPVIVQAYDASGNIIVPPGNFASPITVWGDWNGILSFAADSAVSTMKVRAPGKSITLYYNGDPVPPSTTIVASVNGIPFRKGSATISGTGALFTSYTVPTGAASQIIDGPDGNLWFAPLQANMNLASSITTSGVIAQYSVPNGQPNTVAAGSDGTVWLGGPSFVDRMTTSGAITEYSIPYQATAMTSGPDRAMWFAQGPYIGRVTTGGMIQEYSVPSHTTSNGTVFTDPNVTAMVTGSDGAVWFTEPEFDEIGRITTTGSITEYSSLPPGTANGITAGPDGALWFPLGGSIGRITTKGAVTNFPIPAEYAAAAAITAGSDGALWFTDCAGRIGRITTAGAIVEYSAPQSLSIASGPDGALWFTDFKTIYRMPLAPHSP